MGCHRLPPRCGTSSGHVHAALQTYSGRNGVVSNCGWVTRVKIAPGHTWLWGVPSSLMPQGYFYACQGNSVIYGRPGPLQGCVINTPGPELLFRWRGRSAPVLSPASLPASLGPVHTWPSWGRPSPCRQALLSMEFSRQEYWSGCHFLFQEIFLTQESNSSLLHFLHWQANSLPLNHQGITVDL